MNNAQLKTLVLFEKLSEEQLEWLSENSTEVSFQAGEHVFEENQLGEALFALIKGRWQLSRNVGGHETILTTTDYQGSWAGGIPLIDGLYQATGVAVEPSCFLRVETAKIRYMLNSGFPIASHIIAGISVGARNAEAVIRQQEKMAALGKLSAGLAHELNNPAAAGRRAAGQMRETVKNLLTDSLKLNQTFEAAQLECLAGFHQDAMERAKTPPRLGSLEQSEREDDLTAWLDDHNVQEGWKLAPTLVEANLDTAWLDDLEAKVGSQALSQVLNWLDGTLTIAALLNQLEQSTERISTLVKAVKEYSYMDQAPQQEVDIHDGLESTLAILAHELKAGITVIREYDKSLPRVPVFGSELNQVWTNLLDNAIDALGGKGEIRLRTWREGHRVAVEIADNGPGIPPEIQSRIFEPFFTTKDVGAGSGLGLDITYRIVTTKHKGDIKVVSQPGNTRFQVYLPIEQA